MKKFDPNPLGLVAFHDYVDSMGGTMLEQQLDKQGIPFETIPLAELSRGYYRDDVHLVIYTSPATCQPVTVAVHHHVFPPDDFGQDYYYFSPMDRAEAEAADWPARLAAADEYVKAQLAAHP